MAPWPNAAIRRVDQRALEEYQAANSRRGFALPREGLMNAPHELRSRQCFEGKVYGLKLMIALGEGVYNLLGYFDEIAGCVVEKRMPLHLAVREYGRLLADVLAEDAEEMGWLRPAPRSIPDMEELGNVMSKMEQEAKRWEDGWPICPVLLLLPVEFVETADKETHEESDDDLPIDTLCAALVSDSDDDCGV